MGIYDNQAGLLILADGPGGTVGLQAHGPTAVGADGKPGLVLVQGPFHPKPGLL
jgi:hypothetical protein